MLISVESVLSMVLLSPKPVELERCIDVVCVPFQLLNGLGEEHQGCSFEYRSLVVYLEKFPVMYLLLTGEFGFVSCFDLLLDVLSGLVD